MPPPSLTCPVPSRRIQFARSRILVSEFWPHWAGHRSSRVEPLGAIYMILSASFRT
jgi:hypothetical protein